MIPGVDGDAEETQTMEPVRPAVPIARARPTPVPRPPPSRVQTQPAGMTLAPGELDQVVATAVVQALTAQEARAKATAASDDTEITVDLQKTVARLKAGLALLAVVGTGALTVLNWYGDQRVAAAAESERRLEVGKALETMSTQHAVDQEGNRQTHEAQDRANRRRDVLQVEQGKDTRRILLEAVPAAKRSIVALPAPALAEAEAAVLDPDAP